MPRGLHDYSVRVCLPAGLKVESPLSTDRLIPGLARISEGFKHCGDPVRGAGCIRKYRACHAVRCRVSVPVRGVGCIIDVRHGLIVDDKVSVPVRGVGCILTIKELC